jgi:hypothetical protein
MFELKRGKQQKNPSECPLHRDSKFGHDGIWRNRKHCNEEFERVFYMVLFVFELRMVGLFTAFPLDFQDFLLDFRG